MCMSIEQAEHALLNFEYFLHHTQIDVIQKTQNRAFKADDMFESNPVKRSHFTELLKSVTSVMCEIGSENTKKPGKKKTPQRYCNGLIYLFILSALGHCYHDNSLMASFASLFYSLSFFTPLPSYLQYLCLKNPHDRCNSTFPFATHYPLLFIPNSPLMKACSLKDKIQKKKSQGVNRLQERQRSDGLEMMQHQSVFCVGFLPSDKNETEQGSLQYQRPLSPVICWEHGEWSLMLFCYQLSSVSLQMNCWYRLMSYSLSLLFFFFLLVSSGSTDCVSPIQIHLTGSHYITKQPHLPLYQCNRWTNSAQALVTLGWWQGNATSSGHRSLLV